MNELVSQFAHALANDWTLTARENQLPPDGDWWTLWVLLAGRGFGKTRAGNEFILQEVSAGRAKRIALIGADAGAVRDILIEGPSGLLNIAPPWCMPVYEPSKRRLTWGNGAVATTFSAQQPDELRGYQSDLGFLDELAAWPSDDALNQFLLGLRIGKRPRAVIATTPRPTKPVLDLLAREGKDVVVSRGSSHENKANLSPTFFSEVIRRYQGTRLERQEIFGEVLLDTPGALFERAWFDAGRVMNAPPDLQRVVVAVDPAASLDPDTGDETGIVVCALGEDGHCYVLEDLSGRMAPKDWSRRAIEAYHRHGADVIVAESNFGGTMVEEVLRVDNPNVSFRAVHASRGKAVRAEPVAALFNQGRAHIVGSLAALEDQCCSFAPDTPRGTRGSPDRMDALVWGLTFLAVQKIPWQGLADWYAMEVEKMNKGIVDEPLKPEDDIYAEQAWSMDGGTSNNQPVEMEAAGDVPSAVYGLGGKCYFLGADRRISAHPMDVEVLERNGYRRA